VTPKVGLTLEVTNYFVVWWTILGSSSQLGLYHQNGNGGRPFIQNGERKFKVAVRGSQYGCRFPDWLVPHHERYCVSAGGD
jgi:hypothetical protein